MTRDFYGSKALVTRGVAATTMLVATAVLFSPVATAKSLSVDSAGLWVEGGKALKPISIPSVAPLVKRTEPASLVVMTKTRMTEPMLPPGHPALPPSEMPPSEVQGQGSGFVIHPSGLALTNYHVIENALSIWVLVGTDPREIEAKVIGRDERTDVALLQLIDPERKTPWDVVPLGDSSALEVGDFVVAIGNPFGLALTVSMGILSARHRKNIQLPGRGGLYDFLQTDASINVGNSGGPLLNLRGEVVGINTAINSAASGIGFAIPINMVKAMLPALKSTGKVPRSWIGVQISPVTREIAAGLGLDRARGALVSRVLDIGPAGEAGVLAGDVVVKFDDVNIEDAADLPLLAANAGAGVEVTLGIIRNRAPMSLKVKLGALPESAPVEVVEPPPAKVEPKKPRFGFVVSELNANDRERLHLNPDSKGVIILKLERGSPASRAGLEEDDIVVGLNGDKVTDAKSFQESLKKSRKDDLLRLVLVREGGTIFIPFVVP